MVDRDPAEGPPARWRTVDEGAEDAPLDRVVGRLVDRRSFDGRVSMGSGDVRAILATLYSGLGAVSNRLLHACDRL